MTQTTRTQRRAALTFTVDDTVFQRVPDYVIGLLGVAEIEVGTGDPEVARLLAAAEDEALAAGIRGRSGVAALPRIREWREAHRAVAITPGRYPCASESLLRRPAKGERLPRINDLVDLCNAHSLASRLPIACCDVAGIGAFRLAPASGAEEFLPLGSPDAPERPEPGEVAFLDERGRAHSRRWNWRQSDVVATRPGRRRLMISVESAHPGGRQDVAEVLESLRRVLAPRMTAGTAPHTVVLHPDRRSGAVLPAVPAAPAGGSDDAGPASWTRVSGRRW